MHNLFKNLMLSCTLLVAAIAGPLGWMGTQGDTNGDTEIDVLDLQHVIAEVLHGADPASQGDVNGDGRVDVLDFQALLSQAQQAASAPVNSPRQDERGATTTTRSGNEVLYYRACTLKSVSPEEGKSASSLGARPAMQGHPGSVRTERHLQNLSPHAPPVVA